LLQNYGSYYGRKYKTLNSNISASRQNIKDLVGNFWAIYVRTMHANFKASSSTGVGGEWGDIPKVRRHAVLRQALMKFFSGGINSSVKIITWVSCRCRAMMDQLARPALPGGPGCFFQINNKPCFYDRMTITCNIKSSFV